MAPDLAPALAAARIVKSPRTFRGCALALLSASSSCAGDAAPPRSVILISIDTLRADHTGVYGYERDTTPYLDRLAGESLVFERAFAPSAWTLTSHMTMLTGLYPNQHGVLEPELALAPGTPTLAERLRERGYRTIGLYYEGLVHERHGFGRGFDVFQNHRDAEEAGAHLREALGALDGDQPFFLFLHLFDVHCGPLDPVEPGPVYECPPPYDRIFAADAAERLPCVPELALWEEPFAYGPRELEALVALYDGGVRYVDAKLEEWIEGWKAEGLLERTLLVVTSDHGESLGQRGWIQYHGGFYQEGLHVPLLVRHPDGLKAGEREAATASHVDLMPTILEWAGMERPARLPGASLLGALPGGRPVLAWDSRHFEVLVAWPEKFLRVRYPFRHHSAGTEECLRFDLERDPGELSRERVPKTEFLERLGSFLSTLDMDHPKAVPIALDQASAEALRHLGYADDAPPAGAGRSR